MTEAWDALVGWAQHSRAAGRSSMTAEVAAIMQGQAEIERLRRELAELKAAAPAAIVWHDTYGGIAVHAFERQMDAEEFSYKAEPGTSAGSLDCSCRPVTRWHWHRAVKPAAPGESGEAADVR